MSLVASVDAAVLAGDPAIRGQMIEWSATRAAPAPPSSEAAEPALQTPGAPSAIEEAHEGAASRRCASDTPAGSVPFQISVDGVPLDGAGGPSAADRQRCVDAALATADIQLRYDPLVAAPALNVWTPSATRRDGPVRFFTYANYVHWIRTAEVRIFRPTETPGQPPLAVVPVAIGHATTWVPPEDAPAEVRFLLRVYDAQGRFDETALKPLRLAAATRDVPDESTPEREGLVGYGETSRVLANIPVFGGTVTANGKGVSPGQRVTALGVPVPVDAQGVFAARQVLPSGAHTVEISLEDPAAGRTTFRRNLFIPDREWFYVGLADLTVGQNHTTWPAQLVTADSAHYDQTVYVDGRLAFYLKGLIKGEYLLTASADTREQPMQDLFSNFARKDPRYLLRRIDPDRFYPVYGDDSTVADDAPTQGKFYVRLDRGDSHVLWGNFQTSWTKSELVQYSRGLYGADLLWFSSGTTRQGEKRTTANAFAADPGTLHSREEFRGTGGSLYYLQHQDITEGSDRVWVEVRDKDSGLVLERRLMAPAQDYEINYLQGRVLLRAPLPSVADGSTLIQTSTLNGNPVYLVLTYEYVPGFTEPNGLTAGVRASHWLTDSLRLGVTGYRQGDDGAKQKLGGADVLLRHAPGTFLRGEWARSSGTDGEFRSIDGGFNFQPSTASGTADATRIEGAVDLGDLVPGYRGKASAYWQERQGGFSGPGQLAPGEGVRQMGGLVSIPMWEATAVDLKADQRYSGSQHARSLEANVRHALTREWQIGLGVRHEDLDTPVANASSVLSQRGERTDAIVRLHYRPLRSAPLPRLVPEPAPAPSSGTAPTTPDGNPSTFATPEALHASAADYAPWDVYGFVQETLSRTGDRSGADRAGVGGHWQLTTRFRLGGEVSGGDGGLGGKVSGDYQVDDRSNAYLTYTLETERPDVSYRGRYGTWVTGTRYRLSDQVGVFGETRWTHGAGPQGLTRAFGLDLAPTDRWTYGIKTEWGTVSDPQAGDLDRKAVGISAAYKTQQTKAASGLEFRDESGTAGDRTTWLMRNTLGHQLSPSWRLLGKLNFSVSDASRGAFYDGDFVEGVAGAAYRPVRNDAWNTLFKYTYYYTLPSPGQVTGSGQIADYAQRSHVLSVDTIYDVLPWLSLGAKYGVRCGELKPTKEAGDWLSSAADLMVLRADLRWIREWDVVVEARRLHSYAAHDTRAGFLVAVYRHVVDNVKLGVGYNFTDFSDSLTDLSYRNHGAFLNVVSAF